MQPNIVLVSLDTLRADVAYSGKFPTMELLRQSGTRFRRVVSSVPFTPASHATIFTGLHPPRHGLRHLLRHPLLPSVPTLASMLEEAGYTTGAVVSCPGLNKWYGLSRGFSHYDDEIPKLADGRDPLSVIDVKLRGTALKRAPLVVERALEWLASAPPEPWFLFAHFFDAHWPYEPPEDFGIEVANPYEGEVAYMDHYLGVLLKRIAQLGYSLDDTILVCLSDHGEDLRGWYPNDHAADYPQEDGHGCLLFDATLLVPLWIRAPGRVPAGYEVANQVRLADVTPTILELAGLAVPPCDGRSLLPCIAGVEVGHRPAYCETFFPEERAASEPLYSHLKPLKGMRLEDRYKIIWEVGGDMVQTYDIHTDPEEKSATADTTRTLLPEVQEPG